jgi:hypothetical protein
MAFPTVLREMGDEYSRVHRPVQRFHDARLRHGRRSGAARQSHLEGLVTQLYTDLRPGAQPAAVFTMQIFVTRAIDHTIVLDRTYSHAVYIPNQRPARIVQGMTKGFHQCLVDLERNLRALNLKAQAGACAPTC